MWMGETVWLENMTDSFFFSYFFLVCLWITSEKFIGTVSDCQPPRASCRKCAGGAEEDGWTGGWATVGREGWRAELCCGVGVAAWRRRTRSARAGERQTSQDAGWFAACRHCSGPQRAGTRSRNAASAAKCHIRSRDRPLWRTAAHRMINTHARATTLTGKKHYCGVKSHCFLKSFSNYFFLVICCRPNTLVRLLMCVCHIC